MNNDNHSIFINEESEYLGKVKKLWRQNSNNLGYFPEGAFQQHAANKCILIATTKNEFSGYLLFRKVVGNSIFPQAVIVHLCIEKKYRAHGVARFLVEELCSHIQSTFLKVRLSCREDYDLAGFWAKLGFVCKGEKQGQSGYPLFLWERVFREIPLPLLEFITQTQQQKKYRAVIDTNILFRLQDDLPDIRHEKNLSMEAKALEAEWIRDDISLVVTNELYNEIHKNEDGNERKRRISYVKRFAKLSCKFEEVEKNKIELRKIFPQKPKSNTLSDICHLAHAIAGNIPFFITQDFPLLNKSEIINDKFGIRIVSPGVFISHIDKLSREIEYQPRRLAGSNRLEISKLSTNQLDELYNHFRNHLVSEKKSSFLNQVSSYLSSPSTYELIIFKQWNTIFKAFVVYDKSDKDILKIPIIRVSRSNDSPTVLRYVIRMSVIKAISEKRQIIVFSETERQEDFFSRAFLDNHFVNHDNKWMKINIFLPLKIIDIKNYLEKLKYKFHDISYVVNNIIKSISNFVKENDTVSLVEIEKMLFPIKIIDAKIKTYVVPIKSVWAANLFDEKLAGQLLFGAEENLIMRLENVYFRNKKSFSNNISRSRILWYVVEQRKTKGTKQIRACSYLDELVVDSAKHLFKQYSRFGIYKWDNILNITKGDPNGSVMAIKFSNSELLNNPITLDKYKEILWDEEHKQPFLESPQLISENTFCRLYKLSQII